MGAPGEELGALFSWFKAWRSGREKSFSCLAKELFSHLERKCDFRAVFGVFRGVFFVCFVLLFLLPGVIFFYLFSLFPWSLEKVWNVFLSKLLRVRA